ncbi:MAG: response regulator [Burkholderiales bacterium]
MKILIAEDNTLVVKILYSYLSPLGEITLATNGLGAFSAAKAAFHDKQPYDLICLDIMMPEVDGIAALHSIRQMESSHGISREARSKIIMTTAASDRQRIEAAIAEGCDGFLVKPVSRERLFAELRRLGFDIPERN